jgi:5-methylcytosine-specific restriction endonuclease McrA
MKKNPEVTPKSKIVVALRRLWLYSRERTTVLKRDDYKCVMCQIKASQSKDGPVKIQVHHKKGIQAWDELVSIIQDKILCTGHLEDLEVLCVPCHNKKTYSK